MDTDNLELFSSTQQQPLVNNQPLAVRMRPKCLKEVVGQSHILGKGKLLPQLIEKDQFGSLFFYGPPGCGKTTLASVIAEETRSKFVSINAVLSNVAELREILKMARYRQDQRTILFIDEIHRFNRAQQDLLLPDVEAGNIRLIGATTHNPGFYINAPLLSRSHLFRLEALSQEEMVTILQTALNHEEHGLKSTRCTLTDEALSGIAALSDGDVRRSLNALETIVLSQPICSEITHETVQIFASERQIRYDANEDEHYDTISAFIKSMRASDPDATLYWLAKMLYAGEDPRFIARRIVICASEDVGMADPDALVIASSAARAVEFVGMPEARIPLAEAALYVSCAPKSKSVYNAISCALDDVEQKQISEVPESYTSAGSTLYADPHKQPYLATDMFPPEKRFYIPGFAGRENWFRINLEKMRLRRDVLCKMRQLSVSERKTKSARIAEKVLQQDEVKQAQTILLYASFESEVETFELMKMLKSQQKRIILPVVQNSGLKLVELTKQPEEMKPGKWGIPEPQVSPDVVVSMAEINLVIVPGVAFDEELHRLGRGKGFYDMLLRGISADIRKFAIAFDCQIVKEIPTTSNDMRVDKLITESRVIT